VEQEAADELVRRERHGFVALATFEPIILPCEGDAVVVGRDQTAVGDRDAMGVARQIREHGLRSGERSLGVDEPARRLERGEEGGEGIGVDETSVLAEEPELARRMGRGELLDHQPAKELREHAHRHEEGRLGRDPLGSIGREPTAGYDHVDG
jgi:hypothetical protein